MIYLQHIAALYTFGCFSIMLIDTFLSIVDTTVWGGIKSIPKNAINSLKWPYTLIKITFYDK